MKKIVNNFIFYLGEYFNVYLPKQRNSSKHTIAAARQTWNILLLFICKATKKNVGDISFDDLSRKNIISFLDISETERNWTAATRNHRLSLIRSFFSYASAFEGTLAIYSEQLKTIPLKNIQINRIF